MKVCNRFTQVFVVDQVSHPYIKTDVTLELKSISLVRIEISFDLQMLFSALKVFCALPILALMSASVKVTSGHKKANILNSFPAGVSKSTKRKNLDDAMWKLFKR